MTEGKSIAPRTIDVSKLPSTLFDFHAPLWWGNLLLLLIETTMFGILVASYFSVAMNLSPFPPPRADQMPVLYNSEPNLFIPTINLIVLLASLIPAVLLDLNARKQNEGAIKILLPITLAFNLAAIILRFYEFDSLHFRWDDNAYGSTVWTILGTHLLHLFVMFGEDSFMLLWTFKKGLDEKHALDLTVLAIYWYWVVGIWVLLYSLVYLAPRIL